MEQIAIDADKWFDLGRELRVSADGAHERKTPDVQIAYSFLCDNPECFGFEKWPEDMPNEAPIELIAGYYGV